MCKFGEKMAREFGAWRGEPDVQRSHYRRLVTLLFFTLLMHIVCRLQFHFRASKFLASTAGSYAEGDGVRKFSDRFYWRVEMDVLPRVTWTKFLVRDRARFRILIFTCVNKLSLSTLSTLALLYSFRKMFNVEKFENLQSVPASHFLRMNYDEYHFTEEFGTLGSAYSVCEVIIIIAKRTSRS